MKKLLSALLAMAIAITSITIYSKAEEGSNIVEEETTYEKIIYSYNGFSFEKLSHAESSTETSDGVIDYVDGKTVAHVNGEENNGDSVQSYSYCSVSSGDWIYVNTMYGALSAYNTINSAIKNITEEYGIEVSDEFGSEIIDALYNGEFNKGKEEDGSYEGSVLFKFNVNTGETVILMSRDLYEENIFDGVDNGVDGVPIFRNAIEIDGELYFVGLVSTIPDSMLNYYKAGYITRSTLDTYLNSLIQIQTGIPVLYKVTPSNDNTREEVVQVKKFMSDEEYNNAAASLQDIQTYGTDVLYKSAFTSTRAIGTYEGALVVAGLEVNEGATWDKASGEYAPVGAVLYISTDPSNPDSYIKIADQEDMFNYPAIWRDGASGGGGVYQVLEYNGELYVAIVTGTKDTKDAETGLYRGYAVIKGTPNNPSDYSQGFTWTPVIGDLDDGAKYTFAIDPERGASNAVTMQIYNGYLYLGDYNDVNGSLNSLLSLDLAEISNSVDQSVNLYRLDSNDDVELVVGDATNMFPEGSITGWKSGYASGHMMQYTWMTTVYDGKMYLSSMDMSSLLSPIAQFTNGQLLNMSEEEWESEISYLETVVADLIVNNETEEVATIQEIIDNLKEIKEIINSTSWTKLIELIVKVKELISNLEELKVEVKESITEFITNLKEFILNLDLTQVEYAINLNSYLEQSVAGFDLYVFSENEEGELTITTATLDGFGDKYNHGLRIFEEVNDELIMGTANPYKGTQLWKLIDVPYEATIAETIEELGLVIETTDEASRTAMIVGQDDVSINETFASTNEISASIHAQVAEQIVAGSDIKTGTSAAVATVCAEVATAAANQTGETLNEIRVSTSKDEIITLAGDAYNAKEIAVNAATEAETSYAQALKDYNDAVAECEAELAAGLIDAKEAEARANEAKAIADEYYEAKLEAKRQADLAVVAAAQALLEAENNLEEANAELDALIETIPEDTRELAKAYLVLKATKAAVEVAELTVKSYEYEIKVLSSMIDKLDVAIAEANSLIDELEANIDDEYTSIEDNLQIIEKARNEINLVNTIRDEAYRILEEKETLYYKQLIEYQTNIINGVDVDNSVINLTNIIVAHSDFYSRLDPEFGFGASSITWVNKGDKVDGRTYNGDKLVFYVVTSDNERIFYEAAVSDEGVVQYYKVTMSEMVDKSTEFLVEAAKKLVSGPNNSESEYVLEKDGICYPIVYKEKKVWFVKYYYPKVTIDGKTSDVDATKDNIVEATFDFVLEPETVAELTDSNTITDIITIAEDPDAAVANLNDTIKASKSEIEQSQIRIEQLENDVEKISEYRDSLEEAYDLVLAQKGKAETGLYGSKVDQLISVLLEKGVLKETSTIIENYNNGDYSGIWGTIKLVADISKIVSSLDSDTKTFVINSVVEIIGDESLMNEVEKLYDVAKKYDSGELTVDDVIEIIEMIETGDITISATLRYEIAKQVQEVAQEKFDTALNELQTDITDLKTTYEKVKECEGSYAKAVKEFAEAIIEDAEANIAIVNARKLKIVADAAAREATTARLEYEALAGSYGPTLALLDAAREKMEAAQKAATEAEEAYEIAARIAEVAYSSDFNMTPVINDQIEFEGKDTSKRYDLIARDIEDQETIANSLGMDTNGKYFINFFVAQDGLTMDSLELTSPVTIEIDVPQTLANLPFEGNNNVRSYNVYCVHNGVKTLVASDIGAKDGRISFKADKFSTYIIEVYDTFIINPDTSNK